MSNRDEARRETPAQKQVTPSPMTPRTRSTEFLVFWIRSLYVPEGCSDSQMEELERLTPSSCARRRKAWFAGSGFRRVLGGRLVDRNNGPVPLDQMATSTTEATPTQKAVARYL
jgi:hypothetical protein